MSTSDHDQKVGINDQDQDKDHDQNQVQEHTNQSEPNIESTPDDTDQSNNIKIDKDEEIATATRTVEDSETSDKLSAVAAKVAEKTNCIMFYGVTYLGKMLLDFVIISWYDISKINSLKYDPKYD